jgi:hypothetical protein
VHAPPVLVFHPHEHSTSPGHAPRMLAWRRMRSLPAYTYQAIRWFVMPKAYHVLGKKQGIYSSPRAFRSLAACHSRNAVRWSSGRNRWPQHAGPCGSLRPAQGQKAALHTRPRRSPHRHGYGSAVSAPTAPPSHTPRGAATLAASISTAFGWRHSSIHLLTGSPRSANVRPGPVRHESRTAADSRTCAGRPFRTVACREASVARGMGSSRIPQPGYA